MKLHQYPNSTVLFFICPGCGFPHPVHIDGAICWQWNGDMEKPTFSPSLLLFDDDGKSTKCHSFIRDGKIQFLSDCKHKLVGQTVEIPDWEDRSNF